MSAEVPRGVEDIRLVRIGRGLEQVDLQPCGGTHVARTAEIGAIKLHSIEDKGPHVRRVTLLME